MEDFPWPNRRVRERRSWEVKSTVQPVLITCTIGGYEPATTFHTDTAQCSHSRLVQISFSTCARRYRVAHRYMGISEKSPLRSLCLPSISCNLYSAHLRLTSCFGYPIIYKCISLVYQIHQIWAGAGTIKPIHVSISWRGRCW